MRNHRHGDNEGNTPSFACASEPRQEAKALVGNGGQAQAKGTSRALGAAEGLTREKLRKVDKREAKLNGGETTSDTVEYQWGETNGKKYKRSTRLPKKTNSTPAAPAAETPDVPWTWEEDGMTVIRGTARSAPGCHNACGILSYVKDGWSVNTNLDTFLRD